MNFVIMAKRPVPGTVKTRLVASSALDAVAAAGLAEALLECTVSRVASLGPLTIALTGPACKGLEKRLRVLAPSAQFVEQGAGDLGERLQHVWRLVGDDTPIAFLGMDTPDLPAASLAAIEPNVRDADVVIGPTEDGGYWVLAASTHCPALFDGIDWGGPRVYDQTLVRAAAAGLSVRPLPAWSDVDRGPDVEALRRRLVTAQEPALRRLAERLAAPLAICTADQPPPAERLEARLGQEPDPMNELDRLTTLPDTGEDGPDLADASILLVDDNRQNLELMQAYLEELPCHLDTVTDGVEAVEHIERERPDLVLLDVMMPRMSGFEVCHKIKSSPRTRDIIVIMVTALHEVGDFERAVECGTDDFLTKPVNKLELLTRVKSLLRVSLLKRRLDQVLALRQRVGLDDRTGKAGHKLEVDDEPDAPLEPPYPSSID